jgi:hypothetical protein
MDLNSKNPEYRKCYRIKVSVSKENLSPEEFEESALFW